MSKIVIKKRVSLDFLGDEYKGAELVFKTIPLTDYEKMRNDLPKSDPRLDELNFKLKNSVKLSDEESAELGDLIKEAENSNLNSFNLILKYLKEYYISGKFPDEKGNLEDIDSKEELGGLDQTTAVKCFQVLTGQDDPKD